MMPGDETSRIAQVRYGLRLLAGEAIEAGGAPVDPA
jgi:hypothetical protein